MLMNNHSFHLLLLSNFVSLVLLHSDNKWVSGFFHFAQILALLGFQIMREIMWGLYSSYFVSKIINSDPTY